MSKTLEWFLSQEVPGEPKYELKNIVEVRQDNLDEVLEKHTALYQHYTFEIPDIRDMIASLKQEISRTKAAIFLDYKDPKSDLYEDAVEKYSKVTDKLVDSLIVTDRDLQDLEDKLLEWQRALSVRERLRDVFLARESAARAMIQLYISGYFGPSTKGEDAPRVQTKSEELADMGKSTERGARQRDRDKRDDDRKSDSGRRFRRRG